MPASQTVEDRLASPLHKLLKHVSPITMGIVCRLKLSPMKVPFKTRVGGSHAAFMDRHRAHAGREHSMRARVPPFILRRNCRSCQNDLPRLPTRVCVATNIDPQERPDLPFIDQAWSSAVRQKPRIRLHAIRTPNEGE